MKKVIFLDVDGTLVNHSQIIPKSAKKALLQAKENGHYLVLCTGRTHSLITEELLQYFDGVVASAGAHIFWNNQEIFHSFIPQEALLLTSTALKNAGAHYLYECPSGRVANEVDKQAFIKFFSSNGDRDISEQFVSDTNLNPYDRSDIESGFYIDSKLTVEELQKEIGDVVKITGASFGPEQVYNGEITLNGVNKATGMERLLNHIGFTQQDCIAFGDGPNDFEMIEYAHIGVAMGNAVAKLKELANFVTDHIDEDGIYNGFTKLGLID